MKKNIIKGQNGFVGSDAIIAILIIALFSGLIASISYNIYLSNSSLKRMSKANGYIIDMFEYIDKTYYDDINKNSLIDYFNKKYYYKENELLPRERPEVKIKEYDSEKLTTPFKAEIDIQKYNEQEGNEGKLDLVQEITMKITYKLGNKNQELIMKHIKSRENVITPNKPEIEKMQLSTGENAYPIKKVNNTWRVCNQDDKSWYDYKTGRWAFVLVTKEQVLLNDEIDINNLIDTERVYMWIPRYAYNYDNNSIEFLFSNSNSYVVQTESGYNSLNEIDNQYTVLNDFLNNEKNAVGIWTSKNSSLEVYQKLNRVYPLDD